MTAPPNEQTSSASAVVPGTIIRKEVVDDCRSQSPLGDAMNPSSDLVNATTSSNSAPGVASASKDIVMIDTEDEDQLRRDQTTAQLNAINNEIRESQPLTSDMYPLSHLVEFYIGSDSGQEGQGQTVNFFLQGACHLAQKYKSYRRVRGDGNCYYRAFLYALLENLLKELKDNRPGAQDELQRLQVFAKESFASATTQYGYDQFALEMFQEEFVALLTALSNYKNLSQSDLHKRLNEEGGTSEYCTWYMRVLTACKLKSDPERFAAFLCFEDGASAGEYVHNPHLTANENIADFCVKEVEPMGRECGMVQVLALAEIMNVTVAIEYLDGRSFKEEEGLTVHEFAGADSDGGPRRSKVSLLYRPGHYDILYT